MSKSENILALEAALKENKELQDRFSLTLTEVEQASALKHEQTIEITQEINDQALDQITGGAANSENNLESERDECISTTMSLDQKLLQIPNPPPIKFG